MDEIKYEDINQEAFKNKLNSIKFKSGSMNELTSENWYRLSFEEADKFLKKKGIREYYSKYRGNISDGWIKLIVTEYIDIQTGNTRRYWSTSLRPYRQGYGCDGTTDINIHTIANELGKRNGIDYQKFINQTFSKPIASAYYNWLNEGKVLPETIIPETIDIDIALKDLNEINNYTVSIEFGIALYKCGATKTNWEEVKTQQEDMIKLIRNDIKLQFGIDFNPDNY